MSTNSPVLSRRRFLHLSALGVTGAALAACAPATMPAAAPSGEAAPAAAIIELSYLTPDRELENRVKEVHVTGFNRMMEEQGKPFRITNLVGPATDNDIKTKLTLDAAAGTLPDISRVNTEMVADFAAADYILDLSPYLTAWDGWAQYPDVLKRLAVFEGKLVSTPSANTFTFFRRKDVMDAAGIGGAQPKTWDDFYAACDEIASKTDAIPCGLPAATPWGGGTWKEGFQMVWLGFDGVIYDETDDKWVVSSPGLLKAFQVYETLAGNGWLTVDELLSPNPWEPIKYQGFPQGNVMLVTGGDWQWTFDWGPNGATPIEGLYEKVDRWEWPEENGNPFTFVSGGAGPVVATTTKSAEGAAAFIMYMQEPDSICNTIPVHIGGPSGRLDLAEKCSLYAEAVNGKMAEATELFQTGRAYNFNRVGGNKIAEGVGRATEAIITGVSSAEAAMEDFAQSMIEALGEEAAKRA